MNENLQNDGPQWTRRNFLSNSTVAVGGAVIGSMLLDRSAFAAGGDELKIALIGCGGRGSGAASQALNVPGNKLVAMGDTFQDRLEGSLKNLQREHPNNVDVPPERQFVGFDAYKKAIALADVVILATPPGFRPLHFEEAVRQGKHIFMEKPVATDAAGIRRVLAAAEESKKKNLKVGVGLQRRHDPGYIETIHRLQGGAIGDINTMRVYWNDAGVWVNPRKEGQGEVDFQMRNWYYFVWLCGDHIVEQHIHNLDVANWIKNGPPVRARGMGGRQVRVEKEYGEIFDHHAVEFFYADGSTAFSQCRHIRGCWSSVSEHAIGAKGYCDVGGNSIKFMGGGGWKYKSAKKVDPYQQEHDDLFAAIRNNLPYNEAKRGAESTMTAILGRMATYSGNELQWDDALNSKVIYTPDDYDNMTFTSVLKSKANADGFYPVPVPGKTQVL
ncbi:MAG TPA: Gfo/Idh/MocA family oxidoreductase [Candidatus Limnocylindria bacterium]|nr:Gfo/Idh/MocA family oxidoreductase [Candidatus Limnocylindria bacterium]